MADAKHKAEDLKGRAKEAAGALTDNDRLKKEGTADRVASKAKDTIDDIAEKARDVVDRVKDLVQRR